MRRFAWLAALIGLLAMGAGCSSADEEAVDNVGDSEDEVTAVPGSLASVVLKGCTTTVARPLTDQLVAEIACLSPGALASIESIPNTELEPEVVPLLQVPVIKALTDAAAASSVPLKLTSALRTLPQQYLLRRWAANRRCGVTMAAGVGASNHEGGVAVDLKMSGGTTANKKIRAAMAANHFKWLGAADPFHFHYDGTGDGAGVALEGLSVIAFKRLWNRNHPEAPLVEDEKYDATVEAKLKMAPVAGFPIGARCDEAATR